MSDRPGSSFIDFIMDKDVPFSKERYRQIIEESKELVIQPLKIMALLIAISGIFAMIFEARHFAGYSLQIYLTRLTATIISFGILVLLNSRYGNKYAIYLVHTLMVVIIASSGYMIYLLPSTLVVNSHILGLIIFTSALFLSWEVKHQVIMVVYYNIVFAASIVLNTNKSAEHPDLLESILFVILLSVISVIGSAVSFKLRVALAEKTFRVQLSEKKFKSIFNNSAEGIFQTTPEGKFLTANLALVKILGYNSLDELMKTDIPRDIYYNSSDRAKILLRNKTDGEVKNYIVKLKKKDGSPVVVKINARMISDDQRSRVFYEGSMQDITEQIIAEEKKFKAEELLRLEKEKSDKLAKEAQESNLIKGQFLANMSHEIRTPMNGIIGYLSLIEKQAYEDTEEMKQFAISAKNSADVLLDIINNILDLSKIESGKMDIKIEEFNLSRTIDEAVSVVSSKAVEKSLSIYKSIDPAVPSSVLGDAVRLRQVIINLLSNAIKFTDSGEVRVDVKLLNIEMDKVSVQFSVMDTGVGISNEKLETLFQPFSQVDSSPTRRHGGTGLGLAICKEFVSLMGGEITVESDEGKGSNFIFIVPFSVPGKSSSQHESDTVPEDKNPGNNEQESFILQDSTHSSAASPDEFKILLAEDNLINQKIAVRMLNNAGFVVETVTHGKQAIEKLQSRDYALLLLDIQMPDMDGFMVTSAIRNSDFAFKNIPIVAITAHALSGYKEQCIQAGMNDYLTKPIIADELIHKVRTILGLVPKSEPLPVKETVKTAGDSSVFDFEQLKKMSLGEKTFQEELLTTFFDDLGKRITSLESYLKNKRFDMVQKEAHTIKGSGSSVGAAKIATQALAIELSAKSVDLDNAIRHFINLNTAVGETRELLKNSGYIN